MRDILLVAAVVIVALAAVARPVFGILAFVGASLLNPHSFTWGYARTFPFAQFIAVGTLAGLLFWREPKRLPAERETYLLLGLWAIYGLTTLSADSPDAALTRLIEVSKILLMVVASLVLLNTETRLLQLMKVIGLSLGFLGLKAGLFSIFSGGDYMVWGPEGTFLEANNSIGLALAMNVPILHFVATVENNRWVRWTAWAMLLLSYPAVVCTFSRGAWLGLAAATALIVWRSRKRLPILVVAAILVPLSLPFLPQRVSNRFDDLENYQQEESAQSRFWNWEGCARAGMANPLTGAGFDYYSVDAYARYFPEFLVHWPDRLWSCHSMWLTIFGEHGFPGALVWLVLVGSCLLSLRKLWRSAGGKTSFLPDFGYMVTGSFAAYMVSGTFLDVAYFDLFYQLVAAIIIAKQMAPIVRSAAVERSQTELSTAVPIEARG